MTPPCARCRRIFRRAFAPPTVFCCRACAGGPNWWSRSPNFPARRSANITAPISAKCRSATKAAITSPPSRPIRRCCERLDLVGRKFFLGVGVDSANKNIATVVAAFHKAKLGDTVLVLTGAKDPQGVRPDRPDPIRRRAHGRLYFRSATCARCTNTRSRWCSPRSTKASACRRSKP